MGMTEEVASYNELVSKAVLAFDQDLSGLESRVSAIEALGKKQQEMLGKMETTQGKLHAVSLDTQKAIAALRNSMKDKHDSLSERLDAFEASQDHVMSRVFRLQTTKAYLPIGMAGASVAISILALVQAL